MQESPQLFSKEQIALLPLKRNESGANNFNFSTVHSGGTDSHAIYETSDASPAISLRSPDDAGHVYHSLLDYSTSASRQASDDRADPKSRRQQSHSGYTGKADGLHDSDELAAAKRISIADRIATFRASASFRSPISADKDGTSPALPYQLPHSPSVRERIASLRRSSTERAACFDGDLSDKSGSSKEKSRKVEMREEYSKYQSPEVASKRDSAGSSVTNYSFDNDSSRPGSSVRVPRTADDVSSYVKSKLHRKSASMDSNTGSRAARILVPVRGTEAEPTPPQRESRKRPPLQHAASLGSLPGLDHSSLTSEHDLSLVQLSCGFFGPTYHMKLESGNEYAVKIIDASLLRKAGAVLSDLQSEVSRMAASSHDHVGKYYGMYRRVDADEVHIIMQFLPGRTLEQLLFNQRLYEPMIIHCLKQIAAALLHLHDAIGIAHGHLTPSSVILDEKFNVKLCNVRFRSLCSESMADSIKAAAAVYSSYEQQFGLPFDSLDDMWSVGCIAAEMVAVDAFHDILSIGSIAHSRLEAARGRREALLAACFERSPLLKNMIEMLLQVDRSRRMTATVMLSYLDVIEQQLVPAEWSINSFKVVEDRLPPFKVVHDQFTFPLHDETYGKSNGTQATYLLLSPNSKSRAIALADWLVSEGMMTAHSAVAVATELLSVYGIHSIAELANACISDDAFLTDKLMLSEDDADDIMSALISCGFISQDCPMTVPAPAVDDTADSTADRTVDEAVDRAVDGTISIEADAPTESAPSPPYYDLFECLPPISGAEEVDLFRKIFSIRAAPPFFSGIDGTKHTTTNERSRKIELVQQFKCHEGTIKSMAISHSGKFLSTAGDSDKIYVWAIASLPSVVPRDRCDGVTNSRSTVTSTQPNKAGIPDFIVSTPFCVLGGNQKGVVASSWSKGDNLLVACGDDSARLWDIVRGECLLHIANEVQINALEFHPDFEDVFITGDTNGALSLYDLNCGSTKLCQVGVHTSITALSFNFDGSIIAVGLNYGIVKIYACRFGDSNTSSYNIGQASAQLSFIAEIYCRNRSGTYRNGAQVTGITFINPQCCNQQQRLEGSTSLLVTTNDNRIRLLNITSGLLYTLDKKFKGHSNKTQHIAAGLSAGCDNVICGSDSGDVYVWHCDNQSAAPNVGCMGSGYRRVHPQHRISISNTPTAAAIFAPPSSISRFLHVIAANTNRAELMQGKVAACEDSSATGKESVEVVDLAGRSVDAYDTFGAITLNNISRSESATVEITEGVEALRVMNESRRQDYTMGASVADIENLYGSAVLLTGGHDGVVRVFVVLSDKFN